VARRKREACCARCMCARMRITIVRAAAGMYRRMNVPLAGGRRQSAWAWDGVGPGYKERRWKPGCVMCRAGEKDFTVISWTPLSEPGSLCITSQ